MRTFSAILLFPKTSEVRTSVWQPRGVPLFREQEVYERSSHFCLCHITPQTSTSVTEWFLTQLSSSCSRKLLCPRVPEEAGFTLQLLQSRFLPCSLIPSGACDWSEDFLLQFLFAIYILNLSISLWLVLSAYSLDQCVCVSSNTLLL